nr:hypothetical protein [Kibdelosporangium sp. MJ126-NF4]CTQ88276.1 hypothetical protein [Kibdelosporangium sp. MJ126-NF4]
MQPCEPARDRVVREVRNQAAETLAAVGSKKLTRVALFRASKWASVSLRDCTDDARAEDVSLARAFEWLRIALRFASCDC